MLCYDHLNSLTLQREKEKLFKYIMGKTSNYMDYFPQLSYELESFIFSSCITSNASAADQTMYAIPSFSSDIFTV